MPAKPAVTEAVNDTLKAIAASFKLANINSKGLEVLLHKFFSGARLDVELKDRFDIAVKPREWFFVPLNIIEEVLEKIQVGTIDQFQYDPKTASLIKLNLSINLYQQ